jgi:hypothetical protein
MSEIESQSRFLRVRQCPSQILRRFVSWSTVSCSHLALPMVEITIRKRAREDAAVTQRKFFRKTARGKVIKGPSATGVLSFSRSLA